MGDLKAGFSMYGSWLFREFSGKFPMELFVIDRDDVGIH
jgi:hypothetical protein